MISASGALIGDAEEKAMHEQVSKRWLTTGPANQEFEQRLSDFTGIKYVRTCNSGSSANLLAVATMVEAGLWKPGDEILTAACAFPTTVNPLLLYGLVPVFCDVDLQTFNIQIAGAWSDKTAGIMCAHTLGNPFDPRLLTLRVPIVEDCCDALGSFRRSQLNGEWEHVGKSAHIATCSFFPAHHITTGEGGAVFTDHADLALRIASIRDWGRDCFCQPGQNNSCGRRFECQVDGIQYDHKYHLTHLGYNLKMHEVGAACGVEQIKRIDEFVTKRRNNFSDLKLQLASLSYEIILPTATEDTVPSWFGFPFTIKRPGQRQALQEYLWECGIDSRLVFAGNIIRQPYMKGRKFRVAGSLANSDKIMADSLWVGVWPGISSEQITYMADKIKGFFR